jgi:hypothetical protein
LRYRDDFVRELEGADSKLQAVQQSLEEHVGAQALLFDDLRARVEQMPSQAQAISRMGSASGAELLDPHDTPDTRTALHSPQVEQGEHAKLSLELQKLQHSLSQRVADAERKCAKAVQSADASGEAIQSHTVVTDSIVASVQALEAKLDATSSVLKQESAHQVQQCTTMTEGRLEILERKLTSSAKALSDSIAERTGSVAATVKDSQARLDAQVAGMMRRVETAVLKADGVLEVAESIERRVERELGEASASFEQQLTTVQAKVEGMGRQLADTALEHARKADELSDAMARTSTKINEKHHESNSRIEDLRKQLSEQVDDAKHELIMKHTVEVAKVASDVKLEKAEFSNSVAKLEGKIDVSTRAIQDRFTAQHNSLAEEFRQASRTAVEANAARDTVIADQHAQVTKMCEAMDSRTAQRNGAVDTRFADQSSLINANHASLSALCTRLESKLLDRIQASDNHIASTQQKLDSANLTLESKMAESKRYTTDSLQEQSSMLTRKLQEVTNESAHRCSQIDSRVTQWGKELTEDHRRAQTDQEARLDEAVSRLEGCESKVAKLESTGTASTTLVKERLAQLTGSVDDTDRQLGEKTAILNAAIERVRSTSENKFVLMGENIAAQENELKNLTLSVGVLSRSVESQQQTAQEDARSVGQKLREAQERVAEAAHSLRVEANTHYSAWDGKHRAQQEHTQAAFAKLEQKITDKATALDTRLATLAASSEEAIEDAKRVSKKTDQEHEKRFAGLVDAISKVEVVDQQMCQRLENQMLERDSTALDRISAMGDETNRLKREVMDLCKSLESKVGTRSREMEDKVAERHEEFTRECTEQIKHVDRRLERVDLQQTERVDAVERELAEQQQVLSERAAKLDSKFTALTNDIDERSQTSVDTLTDRCQAIEKKAAEERATIDRKHSTRTTSLLERLNKTDDIAREGRKLADKGLAQCGKIESSLRSAIDSTEAALSDRLTQLGESLSDTMAQQRQRVEQLDVDMNKHVNGSISDLEGRINLEMKPLGITVQHLLTDLASTQATASKADSAASSSATRLFLLGNEVEEVKLAVKAVDSDVDDVGSQLSALDLQLGQLQTETSDLAVEVALHESAMRASIAL